MRFLIDAHLPAALAVFFEGHDVLHTSLMEKQNATPDNIINEISLTDQRILITKDTDFYHSFIATRKPYKLVLVKLGNMRLSELSAYFEHNAVVICNLMENHSFLIIEKERIRILE